MRLLITLALCTLAPLGQQQDTEDEAPSWRLHVNERNAQAFEAIQGMWRLVSVENPPLDFDPRRTVGNMLIAEGFLALEIHSVLRGYDPDDEGVVFQSGMHRFDFMPTGRLRTSLLIGSNNIEGQGELAFEYPGNSREFTVIHSEHSLTLERRDDRTRLKFRRIQWQPASQRDFFGRKIDSNRPTGESEDQDEDE